MAMVEKKKKESNDGNDNDDKDEYNNGVVKTMRREIRWKTTIRWTEDDNGMDENGG